MNKLTESIKECKKILENHSNSDKNTAFIEKTKMTKTRQMMKFTASVSSFFRLSLLRCTEIARLDGVMNGVNLKKYGSVSGYHSQELVGMHAYIVSH